MKVFLKKNPLSHNVSKQMSSLEWCPLHHLNSQIGKKNITPFSCIQRKYIKVFSKFLIDHLTTWSNVWWNFKPSMHVQSCIIWGGRALGCEERQRMKVVLMKVLASLSNKSRPTTLPYKLDILDKIQVLKISPSARFYFPYRVIIDSY